ncbi:MAG TPA: hypothetical protein VFM49_09235, partial [Chloroflexia bacterium]|nr:hypothetical protein [Chloroflexia bacterium]
MLLIDQGQSVLQLGNVAGGTGIQGVLHHRLFGAALAAKGALQGRIRTQATVNLDQACGAGQQG